MLRNWSSLPPYSVSGRQQACYLKSSVRRLCSYMALVGRTYYMVSNGISDFRGRRAVRGSAGVGLLRPLFDSARVGYGFASLFTLRSRPTGGGWKTNRTGNSTGGPSHHFTLVMTWMTLAILWIHLPMLAELSLVRSLAGMALDQHGTKTEVPTDEWGSRPLHDYKISTSPFSWKITRFLTGDVLANGLGWHTPNLPGLFNQSCSTLLHTESVGWGRVRMVLGIVSFHYVNPAQAHSVIRSCTMVFSRDGWSLTLTSRGRRPKSAF